MRSFIVLRFGRKAAFSRTLCYVFLAAFSVVCRAEVGDVWVTTRGDDTPNIRYSLAEVTTSGRIIALSRYGSMMYSDNDGASWEYTQVRVDGLPVLGVYSDIYQVPGGSLMIVLKKLEESEVGHFSHYVRTYLLSSNNNGNTWTMEKFPVDYAVYSGSGYRYYGIDIIGLTMGPGNELIAYGTTTGTNNPGFVYWSIGGAIFRKAGGTWVQAHFGYGPVAKVTEAGGRAVAVSHNAILDSADGGGWNGYIIGGAQISLDGGTLDEKARTRLRVIDVEVINGTYVAQGATFVPYGNSGNIDTSRFDRSFLMTSAAPFDGSRFWQATEEPPRGYFTKVGSQIVALGRGDAYVNGGGGFSLAQEGIYSSGGSIAVENSGTAYITESSETVWKTTNSGSSWTKIWDKDVGPSLRLMGAYGGKFYATDFNDLWISRDLGQSWQVVLEGENIYGSLVVGEDGSLMLPANGKKFFYRSSDNGETWQQVAVNIEKGYTGSLMRRSPTGRLLLPARGSDVNNQGKFYVSDDEGATWDEKIAGLAFGESPGAMTQTKSGRIIISTNTFASFNPKLYFSDDDGDTWSSSLVLRSLPGLDAVAGDPTTTVIEIEKLVSSSTGRVLALGNEEILTSDDEGESWKVRLNMEQDNPSAFFDYEIQDVIQAGKRWVAIGSYRTPYPQSRNKFFLLISDDDGATWGRRPFETKLSNTFLSTLAYDESGKLVISGQNGSIFVSDLEPEAGASVEALHVREGSQETVSVDRPDVEGAIEATYVLVQQSAIVDTDFEAGGGTLSWEAGETGSKEVVIETIDNNVVDGERILLLQLAFETSDDFVGTIETPVSIIDNDSSVQAGLVFSNANQLYTSEAGGVAKLEVALESKPYETVVIHVQGLDETEGKLSAKSFTFDTENWGKAQVLTISGVDDAFPDGDATYDLSFVTETSDPHYSILPPTRVSVTNLGEEAYQVDGETLDGIFAAFDDLLFQIDEGTTITFRIPANEFEIDISSEVSSDFVEWAPGPDPVEGETVDGFTSYSLSVSKPDPRIFVRINREFVPSE